MNDRAACGPVSFYEIPKIPDYRYWALAQIFVNLYSVCGESFLWLNCFSEIFLKVQINEIFERWVPLDGIVEFLKTSY